MAYTTFGEAINLLKEMGAFDFFIPFLLVFTIIYGALEKTEIFGEGRHDINAIIALSIGLIFGITGWAVKVTTSFLPWVGVLAVAAISFLMLTAMFWPDIDKLRDNKYIKGGAAIILFVVVLILILFYVNEQFQFFEKWFGSEEGSIESFIGMVVFLGLIVIGLIVVIKGGGKKGGA